ncbi:MAG: glycoside hydrolase [Pyrinomonadaceae bacterium]
MALPIATTAQNYGAKFYQNMRWRMIGPFRGGRTVGATGVPGQSNLFYVGVNNGGVWKTNDYGRTWTPIFDDQPTGSIGALAVAPSNPDIIYVGSGEGLQRPDLSTGDGIYKSIDAGKTWRHLGLRDGQQIGAIIVDPRDANRLFVAVLGHPYGANAERGVFRSTDGGETFQKVLYKDENTGAIALAFDPTNPQTIYADLWAARQGPWENGAWQGTGSGLYKSTDGGATWRQLTKGLPTVEQGLGRIGIAVAPSDPNRLYANVDAPKLGGVYRSDDAGESWQRVNDEVRIWGRGSDFAEVKVDPKNRDMVYSANTSTYRSTDGGHTYKAIKGAPGGDDYHTIWINPDNPQIILLASDQGATITVNGGQTWSSWYNQPTAQFFHVITDNQFPYWVYGAQQESGSVGTSSRGDNGAISFRDWRTVGVEEYGYIAPDPFDSNIIYGSKASRFNKATGQVQNITPEAIKSGKYRYVRTAPLLFSPVDPRVLYLGSNVLFKTTNGGGSWEIISPDLSREMPEVPDSIGIYKKPEMAQQPRRGVIYTVAPSYKNINVIWAGTDDGFIHITRDAGKTWENVTPPGLSSWSKVSIIDAGRFDSQTAYAAINRIRLDDQRPHIYRTHDNGKTWREIVKGLPDNAPVNVVREDSLRKGLLFAGTERAVYVSFNDGDEWQPLRLNMPATSIRDLVIHEDDLVVGTHGRSFWILDDITPLRQLDAKVAASEAFLFKPQTAVRVRRNVNTDTPLPPEEPVGQNPPDGSVIDYYLKREANAPVTLEIYDGANNLVRRFSSADKPAPINEKAFNVPSYWFRPPQVLSNRAGMQRFVWDLRYPPPKVAHYDYPISANYMDTPQVPEGLLVAPGRYTVKLSVGERSFTQPLLIKIDPRVKTSEAGLQQQFALSMQAYVGMQRSRAALDQIAKLRARLKEIRPRVKQSTVLDALGALDQKAAALEGAGEDDQRKPGDVNLTKLNADLLSLMNILQDADVAPTTQAIKASGELQRTLAELLARWNELKSSDVQTLGEQLRREDIQPQLLAP